MRDSGWDTCQAPSSVLLSRSLLDYQDELKHSPIGAETIN